MLKVMWLMKRKDGRTMADVVEAYEQRHSVLAAKLFVENGFAPLKYERRYFRPMDDLLPTTAKFSGTDLNIAMEMWFRDRAHFIT